MKIKTSELTGAALAQIVHQIENPGVAGIVTSWYRPDEKWQQGGPIIEREKITTSYAYPRNMTGSVQATAPVFRGTTFRTKHASSIWPHPPHRSHALLRGIETGR